MTVGYQIILGLINLITACGLGASLVLLWLLGSRDLGLDGVRVMVATVGLTLAILLFTDLAMEDPYPNLTWTLLRRGPGRLLLSGGLVWFLYKIVRRDPHGASRHG